MDWTMNRTPGLAGGRGDAHDRRVGPHGICRRHSGDAKPAASRWRSSPGWATANGTSPPRRPVQGERT